MKILLFAGLVVLVLVTWLTVPLPVRVTQTTKHGEADIDVQTPHIERMPRTTSLVLIAGGIALTLAGTHRRPLRK